MFVIVLGVLLVEQQRPAGYRKANRVDCNADNCQGNQGHLQTVLLVAYPASCLHVLLPVAHKLPRSRILQLLSTAVENLQRRHAEVQVQVVQHTHRDAHALVTVGVNFPSVLI